MAQQSTFIEEMMAAGRGVIGFGLSNDERRGDTTAFGPAFAIAERAGLALVPHGGELRGPAHVTQCLDHLHPHRLGHGVRAAESEAVLDRLAESGVALEVCPTSNVSLGVYATLEEVPVRTLTAAGIDVALGADDPLLFGSRLNGQYAVLRAAQDFTDVELAELARMSIRRSYAPSDIAQASLTGVDEWLRDPREPSAAAR